MKSIYKYIVCVCTALAATSCDFLDVVPDNVATEEHAFADRYTVKISGFLLLESTKGCEYERESGDSWSYGDDFKY